MAPVAVNIAEAYERARRARLARDGSTHGQLLGELGIDPNEWAVAAELIIGCSHDAIEAAAEKIADAGGDAEHVLAIHLVWSGFQLGLEAAAE